MRLILLLGLEKEVFDEHCCLKEDNADLIGGNLFHIFDILSKTCEVALQDQVPVG